MTAQSQKHNQPTRGKRSSVAFRQSVEFNEEQVNCSESLRTARLEKQWTSSDKLKSRES